MKNTVINITHLYLSENGFDGLINDFGDCGCFLDDLMPCDSETKGCEAGYRHENQLTEFGYCDVIKTIKTDNKS